MKEMTPEEFTRLAAEQAEKAKEWFRKELECQPLPSQLQEEFVTLCKSASERTVFFRNLSAMMIAHVAVIAEAGYLATDEQRQDMEQRRHAIRLTAQTFSMAVAGIALMELKG